MDTTNKKEVAADVGGLTPMMIAGIANKLQEASAPDLVGDFSSVCAEIDRLQSIEREVLATKAASAELVSCSECDGKGGWAESGCGEGCCLVGVQCDACGGSGKRSDLRPLDDPKMAEYLRGQPYIATYIETLEGEIKQARAAHSAQAAPQQAVPEGDLNQAHVMPPMRGTGSQHDADTRDAARYRWLCANNFDRQGATQVHTWVHSWEPHSQTCEPTEWKQRVRGGALDRVIDEAMQKGAQS